MKFVEYQVSLRHRFLLALIKEKLLMRSKCRRKPAMYWVTDVYPPLPSLQATFHRELGRKGGTHAMLFLLPTHANDTGMDQLLNLGANAGVLEVFL